MERGIDRLANYLIFAATFCLVCLACWYFRSVLVYVIGAAVVSLIGRPIMKLLGKIRIKGRSAPKLFLTIITLILMLIIILGLITQIIPVVVSIINSIIHNIQNADLQPEQAVTAIDNLNSWLVTNIPKLGSDFKIQDYAINWLKSVFDLASVSSILGSVASAATGFGVGLFSVFFIAFFFIKDETLFRRIIGSLVPDKIENQAINAISEIEYLLSRYFVGILIEVLGVTILNFIGLHFVARLEFPVALGIAFITGVLNIIPYVGPWVGGAVCAVLGVSLKFSEAVALGASINIPGLFLTIFACFFVTQMIDNIVLQPIIYSTSIKASPLEIFIVLLMAGHIGGIIGMLIAIPAYTVLRVIASRFYYDVKAIRRLIPDLKEEQGKIHKTKIT